MAFNACALCVFGGASIGIGFLLSGVCEYYLKKEKIKKNYIKIKAKQLYNGTCKKDSDCFTFNSSYGLICNGNKCACNSISYYNSLQCCKF